MSKLEKDGNLIRYIAVFILAVLCGLSFYLHFCQGWSVATAFNLIGIVCNLFGAVWIASGVYLFSPEKAHLENGNPSRNKLTKKLAALFVSSSNVIPFGVLYVIIGSAYQSVVLIGVELKWF